MIKPQAVKVQTYSITPFTGDNKDWLIFWNQFVVEDDNSKISEISKFNYLLELVETALCWSLSEEAKKILELTYVKDIKVLKALIKDLETVPNKSSITKTKDIQESHN